MAAAAAFKEAMAPYVLGNNGHLLTDSSQLVFVCGTLQRGFSDHTRYLGVASKHSNASFVGQAVTIESYPFMVRPRHFPPATCSPILMEKEGTGHRVHGEVFKASEMPPAPKFPLSQIPTLPT